MSVTETTPPPGPWPADETAQPPRFSWPMRIFLGLILFDMIFRSFSALYPWDEWAKEMDLTNLPLRPATDQRIEHKWDDWKGTTPAEVLTSLGNYFNPVPRPETRKHIDGPVDWGKYSLAFLASRLGLLEDIVGFNNQWPMFSPNVVGEATVARARLLYEDGSERIIRPSADPADLNSFSRFYATRLNKFERKVSSNREEECVGWCNLLAHRHGRNADGSPLVKIRLFEVTYQMVPPGAEPRSWYAEQMRLTPDHVPPGTTGPDEETTWQTKPDFWEFDVSTRKGRDLPN